MLADFFRLTFCCRKKGADGTAHIECENLGYSFRGVIMTAGVFHMMIIAKECLGQ